MISPFLITTKTSFMAEISSNGFPLMTMISAFFPISSVPRSSSNPHAIAAIDQYILSLLVVKGIVFDHNRKQQQQSENLSMSRPMYKDMVVRGQIRFRSIRTTGPIHCRFRFHCIIGGVIHGSLIQGFMYSMRTHRESKDE